jgi:D-alanine-D-alanine ligase
MIAKDLLIAVLMGGPGSEREVSLASGKAVLKALQAAGYNAVEVDVAGPDFELPAGTGLAYNVIHGTFGEDGQLQQILEDKGVPYTGAGVTSSRIAFDKNLAKAKFLAAGVPTPASEIVERAEAAEHSGALRGEAAARGIERGRDDREGGIRGDGRDGDCREVWQ